MKIKELIEILKKEDQEREVVLFDWDDSRQNPSRFLSLTPSCSPKANTKNLFSMITNGTIEPERSKK